MELEYRINPQAVFGLSFSVPAEVTDKHLKLAGAVQLKALLWLLRHNNDGSTDEDMRKALGLKPADISDAMQYWVECGLVLRSGADGAAAPAQSETAARPYSEQPDKPSETTNALPPLPETKPTHELIVKRASESEEIRFLFNQAQIHLGRTLGHDTQSALIMMLDTYGLKVEVILMLIDYCVSIGKQSLSYITKMGKTWGEDEIDSIEKADERIKQLRRGSETWKRLTEMTGITTPRPTRKQNDYLIFWTEKLGFNLDMIYLAYEEMADHTEKISFPYMDKVLKTWYDNGIKTEDAVRESKIKREEGGKTKSKGKNESYEPSYDLDEFVRQSMNDDLIYKPASQE